LQIWSQLLLTKIVDIDKVVFGSTGQVGFNYIY